MLLELLEVISEISQMFGSLFIKINASVASIHSLFYLQTNLENYQNWAYQGFVCITGGCDAGLVWPPETACIWLC